MAHQRYARDMKLNRKQFKRRTGVYPETFQEMEAALQAREERKQRSGWPPALSVENALVQSGTFALPGKKALLETQTVWSAVLVDVPEVPCERPKKSRGVVQRKEKASP